MSLVVDGILTRKLPRGLILVSAFLAIAIEVLGIPALPVAVGAIRLPVDRRMTAEEGGGADAASGPGVLLSSGLIARGAVIGVIPADLAARHLDEKFDLGKTIGAMSTSNIVSIIAYVVLLAVPLYLVARRVRVTT